jgi:hypothetical protein
MCYVLFNFSRCGTDIADEENLKILDKVEIDEYQVISKKKAHSSN